MKVWSGSCFVNFDLQCALNLQLFCFCFFQNLRPRPTTHFSYRPIFSPWAGAVIRLKSVLWNELAKPCEMPASCHLPRCKRRTMPAGAGGHSRTMTSGVEVRARQALHGSSLQARPGKVTSTGQIRRPLLERRQSHRQPLLRLQSHRPLLQLEM